MDVSNERIVQESSFKMWQRFYFVIHLGLSRAHTSQNANPIQSNIRVYGKKVGTVPFKNRFDSLPISTCEEKGPPFSQSTYYVLAQFH